MAVSFTEGARRGEHIVSEDPQGRSRSLGTVVSGQSEVLTPGTLMEFDANGKLTPFTGTLDGGDDLITDVAGVLYDHVDAQAADAPEVIYHDLDCLLELNGLTFPAEAAGIASLAQVQESLLKLGIKTR